VSNGHWTVTPEWYQGTAFILGCGPSLRNADVSSLRSVGYVIAVNDSYLLAPWADVLYFCDKKWWTANQDTVMSTFTGRWIVTLDECYHGVKTLRNMGVEGLETDPGGLRHGSNSGYQAIGLAYHLGVSQIVLLGFDMRCDGDRVHWRDRAKDNADAQARVMSTVMLPKFNSLVAPLRDAGVQVWNCTPDSALRCWPHRLLADVVRELQSSLSSAA